MTAVIRETGESTFGTSISVGTGKTNNPKPNTE